MRSGKRLQTFLVAKSALCFVVISISFGISKGAEWSKLKTCNDLGFCRRHRALRDNTGREKYRIPPGSLFIADLHGSRALTGSVVRGSGADEALRFAVTLHPQGVFRLLVDDASSLHKRHVVQDVIMQDASPINLDSGNLKVLDDRAELVVPDLSSAKVVLHFDPFRMDVISQEASSERLISFNNDDLLFFERHRLQQSPSPPPSPSPSESGTSENPSGSESSAVLSQESANSETSSDVTSQTDLGGNQDDQDELNDAEDVQLADDGDEAYSEADEFEDVAAGDGEDLPDLANSAPEDQGLWAEKFQSHRDPKPRGPESIGADILFPFAEHLYGIPERTVSVSLPHTISASGTFASEPHRLYNLDVFEFELDKPLGLYGAVPFIVGRKKSRAAGILWLNAAETYVDIPELTTGSGRSSHWFSEAGVIDLYLLPGPRLPDVYRQYRMLTGPSSMPQRFALGYHQCRWNYRDDADARDVDAKFDQYDIPYDVLWLDIEHTNGKRYFTWDLSRFPDPTKLQNDLAKRGRKMVTIIDPHIKRDRKYSLHQFAEENKFYVMNPEGKSYDGWCWPGSSSYFDFSWATARQAWASRFNPQDYPHFTEHLYTWIDMNEPSVFNGPEGTMPKHLIHAGGVEHREIHNQYGFYVQQATHEGLLKGHGGNDRPFILSRSFFAGSQRYGAVWTGDNTASWEHLESSSRMLIPLQLSGIVFSGADVGGFFGNPSPELLIRWYQSAAFQPFFRGHAHLDSDRREPWLFGDETTALIAGAVRTRYSYLPLWYTLMAVNAIAGTSLDIRAENAFGHSDFGPPVRPVWWHFPDDDALRDVEDEWLVGSSLLVAPVLRRDESTRRVIFPMQEVWYDLFSMHGPGTTFRAREHVLDAPLSRMFVFQRGGRIVPKQERVRRSTQAMTSDPYTLVVALDDRGEAVGELYMDDGRSYEYLRGAHVLRRFKFTKNKLTAESVSGGTSSFDGNHALVERIVILGIGSVREQAGVHVELPQGAQDSTAEVSYDSKQRVAVVRLPGVSAGVGKWSISLQR